MPYRRRRARDGRRDPRAKPSGARLNSYGPYSHGPYSYGPSRPARALVSPRVAPARVPVNTNVCPCFFFKRKLAKLGAIAGGGRGDIGRRSQKKNHAASPSTRRFGWPQPGPVRGRKKEEEEEEEEEESPRAATRRRMATPARSPRDSRTSRPWARPRRLSIGRAAY